MRTHDFGRRRFLRGSGGVAVGLPFLLAEQGDVRAQAGPVPERLVTVFFGNGLPKDLSAGGFEGVLAPLRPHAAKLTMIRGLTVYNRGPGNGHVHGSASFACSMDAPSADTKGGPSLDWVAYKGWRAVTPIPALSTGLDGSDEPHERMRIVHSWRGVKQPNEPLHEPLALFEHIFGGRDLAPRGTADPTAILRARAKVSVLDKVMAELRSVTSDASGYAPAVRSLIARHAETVRELELRAIEVEKAAAGMGAPIAACKAPAPPPRLNVAASMRPETWDKAWPILVDLYVLALRCDLVRFGNLSVVSGGGRFPFTGVAGKTDNAHAGVMHQYPVQFAALAREIFTWSMTKIAYLLARMDDPQYREANGATLLDNTNVLIGTELGEPAPHLTTDMTYMIAGARGRFRRGVHTIAGGRSDVDLYNTVLRGVGLAAGFGDQRHYRGELPLIA
jgi:hypothetical protein